MSSAPPTCALSTAASSAPPNWLLILHHIQACPPSDLSILTTTPSSTARTLLHLASAAGKPSYARLLLARGARVDARDARFWTPLLDAAAFGHTDVLRVLLVSGADVETRTRVGRNGALDLAALTGRVASVALLVEAGVQVRGRNARGRVAMHGAAEVGAEEVVRFLSACTGGGGGDVRDNEGMTPKEVGARAGQDGVVRILEQA